MACITAIGIDDEENVVANLPDRLYPDLAVISTLVPPLKCGTQEDVRSIIEIKTSLAQRASALGLIPLEEHCWLRYASSVHAVNPSCRQGKGRRNSRPLQARHNVAFVTTSTA